MHKEKTEIRFFDFHPTNDDVKAELLRGLDAKQKTLPCKLFYDEEGSTLFDRICEVREYYPTRTEMQIMEEHIEEMAEAVGEEALLVELGSGTSLKTRTLLDHLDRPVAYVPVDIAREHLIRAAEELQELFPDLEILPVCADYGQEFTLPEPSRSFQKKVIYFPGSTIGNFHRDDALNFLEKIYRLLDGQGSLLIGVDLKKDPRVLHAAYNDADGVTAAFNKNILNRLNREAETNFDEEKFRHYAYYNAEEGRIEMHLVSLENQTVRMNGASFSFDRGESIRTECSYKYHVEEFCTLALSAGFECKRMWSDPKDYFAILYMETV